MDAENLGRLRLEVAAAGPRAVARALAGLVRDLEIPQWQDVGAALAEIADQLPESAARPSVETEMPF